MNAKVFLHVVLFALSVLPRAAHSQPDMVRTSHPRSESRDAVQRNRNIAFALESFDLATNSVRASLMVFGGVPSQIAVIVKPVSSFEVENIDPFAGFRSAPRNESDNTRGRFGREIEDMRAMRTAWDEASWTSFSTNLTIDLGPGSGWRVIWIAGKWGGEMERASGTWVHVERSPDFTVVTQNEGKRTPRSNKVIVEGGLKTNVVTLNRNQPACGMFRLHLTETAGRNLLLLASTNLIDWVPILTNLNSRETFEYTDTNVARYGCRFFRVVVVP